MDPDDYILHNWIDIVTPVIRAECPDFAMFGFKNMILDERGNIVTEWTSTPIEDYDIHSNNECMNLLFPRFLGYSVSNIKRWADGKSFHSNLNLGEYGEIYIKENF